MRPTKLARKKAHGIANRLSFMSAIDFRSGSEESSRLFGKDFEEVFEMISGEIVR